MTEEDIVKKVCEIMGIRYSHYDKHDMQLDYFPHIKLTSKPKFVVYSSTYGYWEFAILENMNVVTSTSEYNKTILSLYKEMVLDVKHSEKETLYIDEIVEEEKKLTLAQNFLKRNGCSLIINAKKQK